MDIIRYTLPAALGFTGGYMLHGDIFEWYNSLNAQQPVPVLVQKADTLRAKTTSLPYPNLREALVEATATNKPVVCLWYGSWMPQADEVRGEWYLAISALAPQAILAQFNERLGITTEELRSSHLPQTRGELPFTLVFAPTGAVIACIGSPGYIDKDELQKAVSTALERSGPFIRLMEQASGTSGVERAEILGQTLDLLSPEHALLNKNLIDEIATLDPSDSTGYVAKYKRCINELYGKINEFIAGDSPQFDAAEAWLREQAGNARLDNAQKQQLLVAQAYVVRKKHDGGKASQQAVIEAYAAAEALNSKSELGKGCRRFISYYTQPINLEGVYYSSKQLRAQYGLPWVMDSTRSLPMPGRYVVNKKHYGGDQVRIRNPRLLINGQPAGKVYSQTDTDINSFEVEVPQLAPGDRATIMMDAHGEGKLDGWGRFEFILRPPSQQDL